MPGASEVNRLMRWVGLLKNVSGIDISMIISETLYYHHKFIPCWYCSTGILTCYIFQASSVALWGDEPLDLSSTSDSSSVGSGSAVSVGSTRSERAVVDGGWSWLEKCPRKVAEIPTMLHLGGPKWRFAQSHFLPRMPNHLLFTLLQRPKRGCTCLWHGWTETASCLEEQSMQYAILTPWAISISG